MGKRQVNDQPRLWPNDRSRQLELKIELPSITVESLNPQTQYDPLPSVWEGTDTELLSRMLDFYPRKRPKRVLDASVNTGRSGRGTSYGFGLDLEAKHRPSIVGDNMHMPFRDGCFDVIVYDPPHTESGRRHLEGFQHSFRLGP
jgi:hypothetical protein